MNFYKLFTSKLTILLFVFSFFATFTATDREIYKAEVNRIVQNFFSYLSPVLNADISDAEISTYTCPICYEPGRHTRPELAKINCRPEVVPIVETRAEHIFGKQCILNYFISLQNNVTQTDTCPICRQTLFPIDIFEVITRKDRRLIKELINNTAELQNRIYHNALIIRNPEELTLAIEDFIREMPSESRIEQLIEFGERSLIPIQRVFQLGQRLTITTINTTRIVFQLAYALIILIIHVPHVLNAIMHNEILRDIVTSILFMAIILLPEDYAFDTPRTIRLLLVMGISRILYRNRYLV